MANVEDFLMASSACDIVQHCRQVLQCMLIKAIIASVKEVISYNVAHEKFQKAFDFTLSVV